MKQRAGIGKKGIGMIKVTGATPLAVLDAVAIDTETTGLNVREARIVQFGGVILEKGRVRIETATSMLVDPKIPIPAATTAVHGIDDRKVAGAPAFAEAFSVFSAWCGARPLIGHAIGYDLAVIGNEARRNSLDWKTPRSLCVRILGSIANPDLPDNSLETIAGWLGVVVSGRHSADGDAIAAGRVFEALLPYLKRRGIVTLAEAERACLRLKSEIRDQRNAGWLEPSQAPATNGKAVEGVDPYAYRHRVSSIMTTTPVVMKSSENLETAIKLMTGRKTSSVLISDHKTPAQKLEKYRIITESDILRQIAARGDAALALKAGDCASGPLISVEQDAFVYRAIGRMDAGRIRHLAVVDEAGNLAGVLSARDLLRLRAGEAIKLDDSIMQAKSGADMASAWATLPQVADRLIAEQLDARTIAEIISKELRAMTGRAAFLAERSMLDEGFQPAPCPYAVLVLGSVGRGESLLAADQDNAIIFQDGDPDGPEDRWFAELGKRFTAILDEAGIPLCRGGIMARNPNWRGNIRLWRTRVADWVRRSSPADLLNVDIVFDLMPVYGKMQLGHDFFADAWEIAGKHAAFAKLLVAQLESKRSPFTVFGGLRTDNGRIDLKKYGLFPLVAGARSLAIRHSIREHSTARRLEGLSAAGVGLKAEMDAMLAAHETILSFMLNQQARDLQLGLPVSNSVETGSLNHSGLIELKKALRQIDLLPEMVRTLLFP